MTDMQKYGSYAFIIGIIIAIVAGFVVNPWIPLVLAVLGLIVGILNVTDKEATPFLVAALALSLGSAAFMPFLTTPGFESISSLMQIIVKIFGAIAVFVAPAAFIVAIRAIYGMAKDA